MRVYHLTISVRGRRALAGSESQRRTLVRRLVRLGGPRLLLFALVDDHLHGAIRCPAPGLLARDFGRRIRALRPDLELKAPHLEPVDTRAYLTWLIRYLLSQPRRHRLGEHAALWSGSCFQDLVGARLLEGFQTEALRAELPRLRLRDLFAHVGLEATPWRVPGEDQLRAIGARGLASLAARVYGVGPELGSRTRRVTAARQLAARIARSAGIPRVELAPLLGVGVRSVRRLAGQKVDPRALSALHRQWDLLERAQAALRSDQQPSPAGCD